MSFSRRFAAARPAGVLCAFVLVLFLLGVGNGQASQWQVDRTRSNQVDFLSSPPGPADGSAPAEATSQPTAPAPHVLSVRTTGSDPFLVGSLQGNANAESGESEAASDILEFEYFCPDGIRDFSVILGPPISESRRIHLPHLPVAETWRKATFDLSDAAGRAPDLSAQLLRLDLGTRSGARFQLRNLRLRPPTSTELQHSAEKQMRRKQKRSMARRIKEYLSADDPSAGWAIQSGPMLQSDGVQIEDVRVEPDHVVISGLWPSGLHPTDCGFKEYQPHVSVGADQAGQMIDADLAVSAGRFQVRVPRRVDGRDRLFSSWRVIHTASPDRSFLTPRHFATSIETSDQAATAPMKPRSQKPRSQKPRSQKGLAGFSGRGPSSDIDALGIDAITINLMLTRFVKSQAGPGRERLSAPGPAIFFDTTAFKTYDSLLHFAADRGVVVSAIVLIPTPNRAGSPSPLVHPENDGGEYAMPDLTSTRGAEIYAQVLDRIAARYSGAEDQPGLISNWIAHNEVDFHSVWTNMGFQPRAVYTEAYYRSMRIIHNAARQHNPHARVFASLTHHWVVPDDGSGRQLAPREVLETLQRYSKLEGDFAWGVAYHPYPQSLFASVAWNDSQPTDSLDTPLITIQNLPVLGRFLQQPQMLDSDRAVRPVLLSEQGFHSDGYDEAAQRNQAGSLAFAMNVVRSMPMVETFHYHRWIDHPHEGGLLLGLRMLPTEEHPFGKRKLAWFVYQAIGTDREQEVTAGLPAPESERQ